MTVKSIDPNTTNWKAHTGIYLQNVIYTMNGYNYYYNVPGNTYYTEGRTGLKV